MKSKKMFPHFTVSPINSVKEVIERCKLNLSYFEHYPGFIEGVHIQEPHRKELLVKKVYLFYHPFTRKRLQDMDDGDVIELMKQYHLKPCECAPNYLFGLVAQMSDNDWPRKLDRLAKSGKPANRHVICAFEPSNAWSIFRSPDKGDQYPEIFTVDRRLELSDEHSMRWDLRSRMFGFKTNWFFLKHIYGMTLILAEDL